MKTKALHKVGRAFNDLGSGRYIAIDFPPGVMDDDVFIEGGEIGLTEGADLSQIGVVLRDGTVLPIDEAYPD